MSGDISRRLREFGSFQKSLEYGSRRVTSIIVVKRQNHTGISVFY